MNRIYRNVWNEVTRTYVAAAEIVRGRGKRSKSSATAQGSDDRLAEGALRVEAQAGAQAPPHSTNIANAANATTTSKRRSLRAALPRPMLLEQRFMFDGAAAVDALHTIDSAHAAVDRTSDSPLMKLVMADGQSTPATVIEAEARAEQLIRDVFKRDDAQQQLFAIFNGGRTDAEPSAQWLAAFDALKSAIESGDNPVRVELHSAADMQSALGAFLSEAQDGQRIVLLNADWIAQGATSEAIALVLAEEYGHAMDPMLNGDQDSTGDEGQAFAGLAAYGNANLAVTQAQNDHATLNIGGQSVAAEMAAPYAIAQTHYVPMAEGDIQTALKAINSSTTGNIQTVIAITATSNGTVVVYDHWEDGFEADLANPLQTSTKVWTYNGGKWFNDTNGDGDQDAGETDVSTNQSVILYNAVNPASPTTVDYDGRDKIGSTKAVTVTRAGWSATPGTVLAGAVNVIDSGNAGKVYTLPVGQNVETVATGTNKLFEYTSAHIIATQNGTTVTVDKDGNGTTDLTITLNEGQSYFVNGGLNAGAKVTADKGVGVYLIAGDVASSYENRWFALTPDEQWASSYFAPVSTTLTADPAYVVLYNPNSSAITVNWDTASGAQTVITIAAKSTGYALMPASAAHFYTSNGSKFFAVGVIDADATSNATHDWSYSLVPESYLTDKFVVGWGPGADNVTRTLASGDLNGSPVWLTPANNTTITVDSTTVTLKDGSGATVTGTVANGKTTFNVSKLQSYRMFDADKDQTGLTVYTTDGTLITAAWGEDPSIAGAGTPYLDMGTTVTPYPDYVLTKTAAETATSVVSGASDNDTNIELGEQVTYTVRLTNRAVIDLYDIVLKDTIAPAESATYIADSTLITVYNTDGTKAWTITGNSTVTVKDNKGLDVTLAANTQSFYGNSTNGGISTTTPLTSSSAAYLGGATFKLGTAQGYALGDLDPSTGPVDGLKRGGVVEVTYRVQIRDTINKALADSDYVVTNTVNMTGGTVNKTKENDTQLSVNVTDGEVFFMKSDFSASASSYQSGDTIGLRVVDADQNRNSALAETLSVTVTNTTTGEVEVRTLTETGVNTGIFQATLLTNGSDTTTSNGTLKLVTGNNIKVEYTDPVSGQSGGATGIDNPINWGITPSTYTSGSNTNLKTAVGVAAPPPTPTDGKVEFLDSGFASTAVNFTEGSTLGLRVTDNDQNTSSSSVQTVTVTVTNSTGETETVSLTETGDNTGIFEGTLATSTAAANGGSNSGTLRMVLADAIRVEYTDPITGGTSDNPTKPGITSPTPTRTGTRRRW